MDNLKDMSNDIEHNRYYQRQTETIAEISKLNDKLDKIIESISAMRIEAARVEERVAQIEINKVDYWNRLNRHSEEIDSLEENYATLNNRVDMLKSHFDSDTEKCVDTQENHQSRIAELELKTAEVLRTTVLINRVFWVFMTGFTAYIGNNVFHFF